MHRALLQASIVSQILENICHEEHSEVGTYLPLCMCARVNKLFFHEAISILWSHCGHSEPGVSHLGILARRDPGRAQIYANHVTNMEFGFFEEDGRDGNYGPIKFDVAYLEPLASLNFPKLEYISIYGTGETLYDHLLQCYAQANLETFILQGDFRGTLDTFLSTVSEKCPKIKNVHFECDGPLRVRVGSFLETHPGLEGFSLPKIQSEWSSEDLKSVCAMSELTKLHIPQIDAAYFNRTDTRWPLLDQLRITIPAECIDRLHESAPQLGIAELNISSTSPLPDVFGKLSQFAQLRSLDLTLMSIDEPLMNRFDGAGLIAIGRNCPSLFRFAIFGQNDHPGISGLSDTFLDDLTSNLTNVTELFLDFDGCSSLTVQSIFSVGKNCRQLERMRFPCIDLRCDSTHLQGGFPEDLFPELRELELVVRKSGDDPTICTIIDSKSLSDLADSFVRAAPQLYSIELNGEHSTYERFHGALMSAIDKRTLSA